MEQGIVGDNNCKLITKPCGSFPAAASFQEENR